MPKSTLSQRQSKPRRPPPRAALAEDDADPFGLLPIADPTPSPPAKPQGGGRE